MKELQNLKDVALTLTSDYGKPGNDQKRNLWNAINDLQITLSQLPTKEKEFEIDFFGNVLAGIRIKDNTPEVYGAMNGYGNDIRISDIKITEKKPSKE